MPRPYRISDLQTPGARLVVLGLPVAVRTQMHLRKLGFVDAPTEGAGVLHVRGDAQLVLGQWQKILAAISNAPTSSHRFVTESGEVFPVTWQVGGEAQTTTHVLPGTYVDATAVLAGSTQGNALAILEAPLFAEIYAGTEGWIARAINKKVSFRLTRFLVRTAITPNQITVANLLMGLAGCLCFLSPLYGWQVLGALLLQINSIVDGCDGEVARLKGLTSKIGGWLDTVADDILNNAMFLCLVLGVYWQTGDSFFYSFGMFSIIASVGVTILIYQNLIANGKDNAAHFRLSWEKPKLEQSPTPKSASWFDKIKPVLKRDFFIFIVGVFVVLNIRDFLLFFLLPVWGAFFLYLASFVYGVCKKRS